MSVHGSLGPLAGLALGPSLLTLLWTPLLKFGDRRFSAGELARVGEVPTYSIYSLLIIPSYLGREGFTTTVQVRMNLMQSCFVQMSCTDSEGLDCAM